jgi:hypothetical protein
MTATAEHLAAAIKLLQSAGLACHVAGGWAEELLGLRPPRPHGDVDLIHCGDDWQAVDAWLHGPSGVVEIAAKRFAHKRAFLLDGVCCEVLLVREIAGAPVTLFWGEVPYDWERPLLHRETILHEGHYFSVVAAANLAALRARHRKTQPWRWREPASLIAAPSQARFPLPLREGG